MRTSFTKGVPVKVLYYDEAALATQLSQLSRDLRPVFALLCSRRIMSKCDIWYGTGESNRATRLSELVGEFERALPERRMSQALASEMLNGCVSLLPDSEDDTESFRDYCEEDAVAALAYAIRSWIEDSSQEAAYAGRRAYEAADRRVLQTMPGSTIDPSTERVILAHPFVQSELASQAKDLAALAALSRAPDAVTQAARLLVEAQSAEGPRDADGASE